MLNVDVWEGIYQYSQESDPIKIKISSKSLFSPSLKAATLNSRRNVFGGVETMCSSSEVAAVIDEHDKKGRRRRVVLKVGLICGGSSIERGSSLNYSRSVLDHIQTENVRDENQNDISVVQAISVVLERHLELR